MTRKEYIEKKTGVLFGTYRFLTIPDKGPVPTVVVILRPPNPSHVRFEIGFRGKAFYVTWGHEA